MVMRDGLDASALRAKLWPFSNTGTHRKPAMRPELRNALEHELRRAATARQEGAPERAFQHLERAHILSQRHTLWHVRVHWQMLRFGWSRRDGREIRGQLTRILAAALFSKIWIPLGNTGGANVSPVRPMPVPDDLKGPLGLM